MQHADDGRQHFERNASCHLPLGRIVNDARVGDHHAIIPTDSRPSLSGLGRDEQRLYDMIMTYGADEYVDSKKRILHYRFFDDPDGNGQDAVYGLDLPLMKLVNVLKSAALGYGTEKRVLLLHGPVGSSKSTIVRLLKKVLTKANMDPILINFVSSIVSALLLLFIIVAALDQLGVDTTSLIALLGAAGLADVRTEH